MLLNYVLNTVLKAFQRWISLFFVVLFGVICNLNLDTKHYNTGLSDIHLKKKLKKSPFFYP